MRIRFRIQLITLMWLRIFYLMRIQVTEMMRILIHNTGFWGVSVY